MSLRGQVFDYLLQVPKILAMPLFRYGDERNISCTDVKK